MLRKDIIVIGSSTGGIEAMKILVGDLPADFPGSIFWVQHIGPYGLGFLPEILNGVGRLPASNARNWEEIRPGHIFVAPPDHHLLLERSGHVRITRGPKENRARPAVDPLFRSAAEAFGPRVISIILTGQLDDGTSGAWAVKERGGTAIVQHPEEALAPSMPENALRRVPVDHCLPLREIAPLLLQLASTPVEEKGGPVPRRLQTEVDIAREDNALERGICEWGEPSIFACPECHGVLLQLKEGRDVRFRCHTGHAYSVEALLAEISEHTEDALWNAVRSIEERILLLRKMAEHLSGHQHGEASERLLKEAAEAQRRAEFVRQALMKGERDVPEQS